MKTQIWTRGPSGLIVLSVALGTLVLSAIGALFVHSMVELNTKTLIIRLNETQEKREDTNALNKIAQEILDRLTAVNGAQIGVYQNTTTSIRNNFNCQSTANPPFSLRQENDVAGASVSFQLSCRFIPNPAGGAFPDPISYVLVAARNGGTNVNKRLASVWFENTSVPAPAGGGGGPPPQNQLVFVAQPVSTATGQAISPSVQVGIRTQSGDPVNTSGISITLTLAAGSPTGTLSGTITVLTANNGIATFANLSINQLGSGFKLSATANGLTPATSSAFNVTAPCEARLVRGGAGAICQAVTIQCLVNSCRSRVIYSGNNTVGSSDTCNGVFSSVSNVLLQEGGEILSNNAIKLSNTSCLTRCSPECPPPLQPQPLPPRRCQPFPQCQRR